MNFLKLHSALFFLLLLLLVACGKKEEKYPGFSETESGLFYKLQAIGDENKIAHAGDHFEMQIIYKTEKDSVFLDTKNQNAIGAVIVPFGTPSFKGSFEEAFATLNEGDSVTYLVNADSLFTKFLHAELPAFLQNKGKVKLEVKVKKILNEQECKVRLQQLEQLIDDLDMEEQKQLQTYIQENNISVPPLETGLYYISLEEGLGPAVEKEKTVFMNYKGCFLNGEVFDSTNTNDPFDFIAGKEYQLVKGFEEGIMLLKEGSKAKFIIPSHLAYGESGSTTGIVPPYTTVIYNVEILKVK